MAKIEIYTRDPCPYCRMAVGLLQSKGLEFDEIDLNREPDRIEEMLERSGGRTTVPEIFIDDQLVGGYDDLAALDRAGGLDAAPAGS